MSLTARIPLLASRRVDVLERTMSLCGLVVAVTAAIQRWPAASAGLVAGAALIGAAMVTRRRARPWTIAVADRATIDLSMDESDEPTTWHLAESTVAWPDFAMVALASSEAPRRTVRRAVVAADLPSADRWALHRFLAWSLRTRGVGPGTDESRSH